MINKFISVCILICFQQSLFSEQLSLWIVISGSGLLRKMAEIFQENKGFNEEAYGFREMLINWVLPYEPEGIPDMVQLDETFKFFLTVRAHSGSDPVSEEV